MNGRTTFFFSICWNLLWPELVLRPLFQNTIEVNIVSIFFWIFIACSRPGIMSLHHKGKHSHKNKTASKSKGLWKLAECSIFVMHGKYLTSTLQPHISEIIFEMFNEHQTYLCFTQFSSWYTCVIHQSFMWQQFWESWKPEWHVSLQPQSNQRAVQ